MPVGPALMCCLRIADGLNTITRRGEIGTSVPVLGLRPIRCPFLHHEGAKRRKLHGFATLNAIGDLLEHQFDEFGGFGSRQTDLLINCLPQISSRNGLLGHRQPRYTKSISYLKFKGIALYAWG